MASNSEAALAAHSRFVQRIRRRYGAQLAQYGPVGTDRAGIEALIKALLTQGNPLGVALRIARQLLVERLATLDCESGLPPTQLLNQVTQAMTALAEVALARAYEEATHNLEQIHGQPLSAGGEPAQLFVIGMGKLGARELNVSSDIDLIYVYDHDGETSGNAQGRGRIANQDYFARLVRALYALIGETTEHGFVFRLDLALRPNGNSGPPAVSLQALEEYFQVQGREWERFAWLKSRVVAPPEAVRSERAQGLRSIVVPFVFRRYLDYGVFDALRILHRQIREHANQRSAGRPERNNDVKLSRGGIREVEFIVQLLQVVRGGQYPELRTRPTVSALQRLVNASLMPQDTADALAQAYVFLRQVEHRIQYLDDQQTHLLPTDAQDMQWMASSMGLADTAQLLTVLERHRDLVAREFDALLGGAPPQSGSGDGPAKPGAAPGFVEMLPHWPSDLRPRLQDLAVHPRVLALRPESHKRLLRLLERTAQWLSNGRVSPEAALRLIDWMEPLLRRESYLAMLLERPAVHERLLRMLGTARWPARYLLKHPGVIDELASNDILDERFNALEFTHDLEVRRAALQGAGEDDDETLLNLLRRAHHAEVFRTLARDVEGRITVEQVADDLSALADAILQLTTTWCWQRLKNRHSADLQFGIIAYGKLGGRELGYGSDLDIVFVYDDVDERSAEVYGNLVRKLINWLTVKTGEGDLYEIDTALRPNGSSGLLVSSFSAYANYQQQRGSNTAWTWEHQAMTRARCVFGSPALNSQFDAVREAVITAPRDAPSLREEIHAMRDKVRSARPVKRDHFDIKHSPGGMVDVEFAVQFLVLSAGASHPELLGNVGNIALLQRASACGLLPAGLGDQAASAYRTLRQWQHRARLNEASTQVSLSELVGERDTGCLLWDTVFGA